MIRALLALALLPLAASSAIYIDNDTATDDGCMRLSSDLDALCSRAVAQDVGPHELVFPSRYPSGIYRGFISPPRSPTIQ